MPRRICLALLLLAPLAAAAEEGSLDLRIRQLERTYGHLSPELSPWRLGDLVLDPSVPSSTMILHEHQVHLEPAVAGGHRAALQLELEGDALFDVELRLAGAVTHLTDVVRVDRQRLDLIGRVELELGAEGLMITTRELPRSLTVRIESRLGSRLTALCKPFAVLMIGLDCALVETAMRSVEVPLPGSGSRYLIPIEEIGEGERTALRAYLSGGER